MGIKRQPKSGIYNCYIWWLWPVNENCPNSKLSELESARISKVSDWESILKGEKLFPNKIRATRILSFLNRHYCTEASESSAVLGSYFMIESIRLLKAFKFTYYCTSTVRILEFPLSPILI